MTSRYDIVCLSSQRWDDAMWTNKQHIMSRLGREHRVFHVNFGPRGLGRIARAKLRQSPTALFHPLRLALSPHVAQDGGVTVLDFFAPHRPEDWLAQPHPVRIFCTYELRVRLLEKFLAKQAVNDPIVWVYHPGYGDSVARLPRRLLVYDCVDEYSAFPAYRDPAGWIAERERNLIERADLVFTTARSLYASKRQYKPDETHLVHNVGDAEHFERAQEPHLRVPDDVAELSHPIIGFVGAISDYKLNADWLIHLARERPAWSIVLIGPTGIADPTTDTSRLEALPNVRLLGHRDYATLPAYLKGFDVAVIPYRINDFIRGVFPIKFFEFLATGKPVVISNLPALEEFYEAVLVARNADEFVARCEEALREPNAGRERRIELARRHSWPERIRQLMEHIERKLAEREG
jgi:glycosyltransferase involved in cell wall biosynthesis